MGIDKATLVVDGTAMAARVAAALDAGGCEPVVGIGGDPAALRRIGIDPLPDRHPGEGPLDGIITALTAAFTPGALGNGRPGAGWRGSSLVFVAACDLPWLTPAAVTALRRVLPRSARADVAIAVGTRREPLCALWRTTALTTLTDMFEHGERAVHRVLDRLTVVDVAIDAATVINVNTPADLDTPEGSPQRRTPPR